MKTVTEIKTLTKEELDQTSTLGDVLKNLTDGIKKENNKITIDDEVVIEEIKYRINFKPRK